MKNKQGMKFYRNAGRGMRRACLALAFLFGFAGTTMGPLGSVGTDISYAETISGDENEEIKVDPTGKGAGFSAVLYDNTNGLPTSEANAIAETREGFLWIGSYSGLIRYDGSKFERIDSTTGITSVVSLYVDSKDRLWIGTNDNGVGVMEKGQIRMLENSEGLTSRSIRSFTEDPEGRIYVATTDGMGVIETDGTLHALNESQINDEYICELRIAQDGVIYGETMNGDVFTMKDGKVTGFYDSSKLGTGLIITVLPDPEREGYVYLGTEDQLVVHGKLENGITDRTDISIAPFTYVNSIEHFKDQIWICTSNGVGYLQDGKFTQIKNIPMNNSIDHMLADYEGNLWFTSRRQGVMKIVQNQFTDIYEWYGLPSAVVNSTCTLMDQLFIGTDTGLTILGGVREIKSYPLQSVTAASEELTQKTDLVELLSGCRIRSIIRDSKDRLWIGTYSDCGLVLYDHGNVTCYTKESGLPSNRARTVCERADGTIIVACSGGLAILRDGKVEEVYDDTSGLNNTEILTVSEADNGDMIVGSDGDGIYVISDKKVSKYSVDSGLTSGIIMRIKKDTVRNVFWIVTSNSLAYMTPDYKITTIQKFPYSNNFDLYWNSKGEVWVLSSNGIYVVDADELLKNEDISPVFYNRDNGVPVVTTANSYSDLTASGTLYIAGSTGVAKVNIEEPALDVQDIKMAVPYVEADGVLIHAAEDGSITVPADTKRVTIYSYIYTYSLMNPQVTYHLEGFDQGSVTVNRSDLEPIDYTNLSGGEYRFVMQISDAFGHGSKEMSVKITKTKSTFEKTWFRVLAIILGVLLLALIVFLYIQRRLRKLKRKAEENKIFIREMIEAFAKTIDMKDKYTNGHSTRVAEYTAMLTKELGYDEETVEHYYNIALLHDIGKIAIPPEVLNKPGKLTDEEFKIIKSHSSQGYRVLKDISIMPELAIGAGYHHERPDGKGYPKGVKGDEIPRVAQIIAVADTFDAMYSDRPYRKRMNFEKAVSIIKEVAGTQLTADVVDAFLRLVEKGEFRAEDDQGGGTTEDIDNIHKKFENEAKNEAKPEETAASKTDANQAAAEGQPVTQSANDVGTDGTTDGNTEDRK